MSDQSQIESRIANVGGALLVGAAAKSFRSEEVVLEAGDLASATRLASLLQGIFEDVVLVGGDPPANAPGRRVAEPEGPACALRGLVGALEATEAERVLVLGADISQVSVDLLLALVAWPEAEVVLPRIDGRAEPLCGIYRGESVLPVAREHLQREQPSLQSLLDAIQVAYLEEADLAQLST